MSLHCCDTVVQFPYILFNDVSLCTHPILKHVFEYDITAGSACKIQPISFERIFATITGLNAIYGSLDLSITGVRGRRVGQRCKLKPDTSFHKELVLVSAAV